MHPNWSERCSLKMGWGILMRSCRLTLRIPRYAIFKLKEFKEDPFFKMTICACSSGNPSWLLLPASSTLSRVRNEHGLDFHGSGLPVGSGAAAPTPLFGKESSRVPVAGSLRISEPRVATDSDSGSFAWQRAGSRCWWIIRNFRFLNFQFTKLIFFSF